MAIILNDNIQANLGKPIENKYLEPTLNVPYTGITQVNSTIVEALRYEGLTVNINNEEYWYENGTGDGDLVIKTGGGASTNVTGATNGLSVINGNVELGGTLTGNTHIDISTFGIVFGTAGASATGSYSAAFGYESTASGDGSFAAGDSTASGYYSTSFANSKAIGEYSFAIGNYNISNAPNSAIVGGQNNNIAIGNTNATILGGNNIDLTGTTYIDTTAVSNLAIFNPPTDDANGEVLVWDSATKKVGKTTIAALGGLSGATNGLSTSGNDAILGGTLDQFTTIEGAGNGFVINDASQLSLRNNANMDLSVTGSSALLDINAKTNSQVVIKSQSGSLDGDDFTSGVGFNLDYNANLFSVTDNRATAAGLQYVADYSLDYTDRSLVDKAYVDAIASGLDAKDASIVATTSSDGNIDLTGGTFVSGTTLDGVVVSDGWRVLVKNQTNAAENGIYDYSASASGFTRSADFDGNPIGEVSQGSFTFIVTGDTLSSTSWLVTTPDPITVGATDINFTVASKSFDLVEGTGTTVSVVGANRSVSVELATASGLDFDAAGTAGRLRVASSIAGQGSTLSSGVLNLNITDAVVSGSPILVKSDTTGSDQLYIDTNDLPAPTAITVNNGLTKVGSNVELGGTLIKNTLIDGGGFYGVNFDVNTFSATTSNTNFSLYGSNANLETSNNVTISGNNITNLYGNSSKLGLNTTSVNLTTNTFSTPINIVAGTNTMYSSEINLTSSGTEIIGYNTGDIATSVLNVNGNRIIVSGASGTFEGVKYTDDFSLNYDNRSLVDKEYVDGQITGSSSSASNGLTKSGNTIVLGGTLTGDTTIFGNNSDFKIDLAPSGLTGSWETTITNSTNFDFSDTIQNSERILSTVSNVFASLTFSSIDQKLGSIQLSVTDTGTVSSIALEKTGITIIDNNNSKGLVYDADYSTSGVTDPRWIPDYAAVTGLTNAAATTANNGLTKVGQNFVLGGTLTGNTEIATNGYTIQMGNQTTNSTNNAFVIGYYTGVYGSQSFASGFRTTAYAPNSRAGGYGYTGGKTIFACGNTSFIHSENTASQTASHGALANNSAILGGRDHNIEVGNVRAAIIGGNAIKLTGTTYVDHTAVDNLAIMSTPAVGTTSDSVLVRNSSTGIVKTVAGSELGDANNVYDVTGITSATLSTAEYVVLVQTSGATQTVTLPASPVDGQAYKIKDKGNALTNSITVSGNGNNIDGAANATINTDYGALELVYSSSDTEWYSLAFIN